MSGRRISGFSGSRRGTAPSVLESNPLDLPAAPDVSSGWFYFHLADYIWAFLTADSKAMVTSSYVNKMWKAYAVTHMPVLYVSGFPSLEALIALPAGFGYAKVTRLNAVNAPDWFDDNALKALINEKSTPRLIPSLSSVNLSGSQKVTSNGVKALVRGRGSQLITFVQTSTSRHNLSSEIRTTPALITVLAAAPALIKLDLTIPSKVKAIDLQALSGNKTLRYLRLEVEGMNMFFMPMNLPALQELHLETAWWSCFMWPSLAPHMYLQMDWEEWDGHPTVSYPKLEKLTIADCMGADDTFHPPPAWILTEGMLGSIVESHPQLTHLHILKGRIRFSDKMNPRISRKKGKDATLELLCRTKNIVYTNDI